uniref:Malate dehydrogenase, mitochondrial n=1 Tax=Glossina brevipalpis TaxID=37001 RepID=A0A1A9X0Z8_9MUSC
MSPYKLENKENSRIKKEKMLQSIAKALCKFTARRCINTSAALSHSLTIIGASGGLGQCLSMLMKTNPRLKVLKMFDRRNNPAASIDVSHIDSCATVRYYVGNENLHKSLQCTDIVVITAGVARTAKAKDRNVLLEANAAIISRVVGMTAQHSPNAMIVIITNPVNSLIPLAAEVLSKHNAYDPKRLFGLSLLDTLRANTFVAETVGRERGSIEVPVIGGHSKDTIVPILTQCEPPLCLSAENKIAICERIKNAGDAVIKAKEGKGSAQLSIGYATKLFCDSLLAALDGVTGIFSTAFVASNVTNASFFSSKLRLDNEGVSEILKLPPMDCVEKNMLEISLKSLEEDIKIGIAQANKPSPKTK